MQDESCLGVIFDKELNFNKHIYSKCNCHHSHIPYLYLDASKYKSSTLKHQSGN